jgi:polyhydroxyalkanoate synthesis regulator phasin
MNIRFITDAERTARQDAMRYQDERNVLQRQVYTLQELNRTLAGELDALEKQIAALLLAAKLLHQSLAAA